MQGGRIFPVELSMPRYVCFEEEICGNKLEGRNQSGDSSRSQRAIGTIYLVLDVVR